MSGNSYRGHIHLRYLPYFKHVLYPSNFWFSKFIAGKLGRQVIFILPFVFSLTIQLDNFNYRVFWVFFKFFLIMMCSYNFTVNMHSGYYLQCFYTLYLCTRKTIKQRLKTHRLSKGLHKESYMNLKTARSESYTVTETSKTGNMQAPYIKHWYPPPPPPPHRHRHTLIHNIWQNNF